HLCSRLTGYVPMCACSVGTSGSKIQSLRTARWASRVRRKSGTEWLSVVAPHEVECTATSRGSLEWFFGHSSSRAAAPRKACILAESETSIDSPKHFFDRKESRT